MTKKSQRLYLAVNQPRIEIFLVTVDTTRLFHLAVELIFLFRNLIQADKLWKILKTVIGAKSK